jgi:hypothetical protein
MHAYAGFHAVGCVCTIGVLFGVIAVWCKNLRTNIAARACIDLFEGSLPAFRH